MFDQYDYNDLYEPTLADEIFVEASAKLIDALKENVAGRVMEIERKNDRLEEENKDLREQMAAVNQEKRNLQGQREELERKAARMPIGEFLGQRAVIMHRADYDHVTGPRCRECNSDRVRTYKTPLGKDAGERCPCSVQNRVHKPRKFVLSSMARRPHEHEILVWFEQYENKDSYSSSRLVLGENVYSDESNFADLDMHKTYFQEEAQCQEYCDWLNEQID